MVPEKEEKLEQLERLLESRILQESESLKAFLRFVVLKSVANQDSQLKEYTIATEVFGRQSNYDSRSDSAVRVQAGRLRAKLQEYYTTEGRHDKVLIDLPKGHYTPSFSYLESQNAEGLNGADTSAESFSGKVAGPEAALNAHNNRFRVIIAALVTVCLALAALAVSFGLESNRLKGNSASKALASTDLEIASPLWDDFLRSPDPVLVAFSNTLFQGTAETGMKLLKPLDSPGTSFGSQGTVEEGSSVITDHYTGVGEVMGVYALGDLFYKAGRSIRVKRSLLLTWDDLKTSDIIILGSPAENLLLRDLPQRQDFVFRVTKGKNGDPTFGIVNTRPQTGEQDTYIAKQEGPSRSQISEEYAVVSLLRGLDENHRLLILAGIATFGTQAAAEYVTKLEHIKELITHLNTSPPGEHPKLPSNFQVLIKVQVKGGVPVQISYVTHHVL